MLTLLAAANPEARPALKAPLAPLALIDLIEAQRYGVEYQPLVSASTDEIAGYEALARFFTASGAPLPPQPVFDALHANPLTLFRVEYAMKRLQIEHAPRTERLLLNVDPDAFAAVDDGGDEHPLVELVAACPHAIVEIIENSNLNDAQMSARLATALGARGVPLALDDIGAPGSMLALPVLLGVDYLKFDRSWLSALEHSVPRAALRHLVAFARETGKRTVLEGVEGESQRRLATELGVDYVQGYLFRSAFRRVEPPRPGSRAR